MLLIQHLVHCLFGEILWFLYLDSIECCIITSTWAEDIFMVIYMD